MRLTRCSKMRLGFQKSTHHLKGRYPSRSSVPARFQSRGGGSQLEAFLQRQIAGQPEGVRAVKDITAASGIDSIHFECIPMFRDLPTSRQIPATFLPAGNNYHVMA